MASGPCFTPSPADILPLFQHLFGRAQLQQWLRLAGITLSWRALTPLVVLWGMIYQRLNGDHTCDAVVCYLRSGAVDELDPADHHAVPLSRRLRSESTSAYVQARQRLPLVVVQMALKAFLHLVETWLWPPETSHADPLWHGRRVRLLDGTTFRMRPEGDLVESYGQASNQQGAGYWVVAKSVAVFCLHTRLCLAYAEGPHTTSEPALATLVVRQDPVPGSVYVADRVFGVYRVVQVAQAADQDVVVRLERRTARRLWCLGHTLTQWPGARECQVAWAPTPATQVEPGLPPAPVAGRLICARLQRKGVRPLDLDLFTPLVSVDAYPLADLVALYGLRWEVELDYRHLKTTLEMETFAVQSAALFRLELAVGVLTYNLVCALMVKAAHTAELSPMRLSFSRCLRRVRPALLHGLPTWLHEHDTVIHALLEQLARCRLPQQPHKPQHEPRQVRRRPQVFPALRGAREEARQELLARWSEGSIS